MTEIILKTTDYQECEPIFIIGPARAGTSILAGALISGAGIPGYYEGHYLPLLHDLLQVSKEYAQKRRELDPSDKVMMSKVTFDVIQEDLLAMFKARHEAEFPGKKVWLDKSPDVPMLRALPHIIAMWPKARFVFAKRRSLENVVSRMRKFPHLSFYEHCRRWAEGMHVWSNMKSKIPADSWIEVEQREIALNPETVGASLAKFLKLDEGAGASIARVFADQRPESTGGNERTAPVSLATVGWSSQQIGTFQALCSEENAKHGYSEDESYYAK